MGERSEREVRIEDGGMDIGQGVSAGGWGNEEHKSFIFFRSLFTKLLCRREGGED